MRQTITLSGEPKSTADLPICLPRAAFQIYMTAEGKALKTAYQWEAKKAQWRAAPRGDELARSVQIVAAMHSRKRPSKLEGRSD